MRPSLPAAGLPRHSGEARRSPLYLSLQIPEPQALQGHAEHCGSSPAPGVGRAIWPMKPLPQVGALMLSPLCGCIGTEQLSKQVANAGASFPLPEWKVMGQQMGGGHKDPRGTR